MNYYLGLTLSALFLSNFSWGMSLASGPKVVIHRPRFVSGRPENIDSRCAREIADEFIASNFAVGATRYAGIFASGAARPIYQSVGYFTIGDRAWPGTVGNAAFGGIRSSNVAIVIRPNDLLLLPSGETIALDSNSILGDLQFVNGDHHLIYRQDRKAKLLNLETQRIESFGDEIPSGVTTLSGSLTGKFYAFFYADQKSFIYSPSRRKTILLERPDFANEVTFTRLTHDSSKVIGITPLGTLNIWRTLDGKLIHRLRSRRGQVIGFELSADCRFAALTYSDGYLEVRELNSMRLFAYANLHGVYGALQFRGKTIVARRAVNEGVQTLKISLD